MKIAVSSDGPDLDANIANRFNTAKYLLVVDVDTSDYEVIPSPFTTGQHGAGIQTIVLAVSRGAKAVVTGYANPAIVNQFKSSGIEVLTGITGTVKDTSEVAIEGALVIAIEPDDAENDPDVAFIPTTTAADGTYTIAHLRTSQDYIIIVSAEDYVSDSEADVSVTAGQVTSGKNFTLGTSGGTISGTVYESDGQTEIENAMVQCSCSGKSFASAMSDSNGDYSIALLQAGTYEVTAYAAGYEPETLSNVVVTGTGENSGNDFTLEDE